MPNFGDLIGAFLQNAGAPSANRRANHTLDGLQHSGFGLPSGGGDAGADLLASVRDALQGGLGGAARNPAAAGGIGAILGSLLGGGGDSLKGALGGGALALLASVAMKALTGGNEGAPGGASTAWSGGGMPLGLKVPATKEEEQALQKTAELVIRGMINVAKSDGEISRDEAERIVGKLRESGLDEEDQRWVSEELRRPLDLDGFAAEIPNPEIAAQVYAASLLAVEVDTAAEKHYLERFAQRTRLHPLVVQQIHQTMGVGI